MASKAKAYEPTLPYVAIPVKEGVMLFEHAVACSNKDTARETATMLADKHECTVAIAQITNIYGQVTKTEVLWSSQGG